MRKLDITIETSEGLFEVLVYDVGLKKFIVRSEDGIRKFDLSEVKNTSITREN